LGEEDSFNPTSIILVEAKVKRSKMIEAFTKSACRHFFLSVKHITLFVSIRSQFFSQNFCFPAMDFLVANQCPGQSKNKV